jgi:hypothetical protein
MEMKKRKQPGEGIKYLAGGKSQNEKARKDRSWRQRRGGTDALARAG